MATSNWAKAKLLLSRLGTRTAANAAQAVDAQPSATARWRPLGLRSTWRHPALGIAVGVLTWSSAYPDVKALTPSTPKRDTLETVVIIAVDGVRWQELFLGADPDRVNDGISEARNLELKNLSRLSTHEGAIMGGRPESRFSVNGPSYMSLPGYTQLFSGRAATPCRSNYCARTKTPTLFDAVAEQYGPENAVVISSWPELERAAVSDAEHAWVSAGRNAGAGRDELARRGVRRELSAASVVSPKPGLGDYRPDAYTGEVALAALRELEPHLMFIGFGDTDEYAHYNNYRAYLEALEHFDAWLGRFLSEADELRARGRKVSWFITTDHGRATEFYEHGGHQEAGPTWLIAGGDQLTARGVVSGVGHTEDIAPTAAALLGLTLPQATGRILSELL